MSAKRAQEVYEEHIKRLPPAERLRLLALLAEDVARYSSEHSAAEPHDIMELHGLGKELWEGIDPQQYVNDLRREWGNHQ